jgi:hypothetical protein
MNEAGGKIMSYETVLSQVPADCKRVTFISLAIFPESLWEK